MGDDGDRRETMGDDGDAACDGDGDAAGDGDGDAACHVSTYRVELYYRALTEGVFSFGVEGSELWRVMALEPMAEYERITITGMWDGEGDFTMSFDGVILIYDVFLGNDAFADAIIDLRTQISQTAEKISLLASKDYVDAATRGIYAHYAAELSVMADGISGVAHRVTALETASAGWVTTADGNVLWAGREAVDALSGAVLTHSSEIRQLADEISTVVTEVDGMTGEELVSRINQTASTVTIDAQHIHLEGDITANGNVHINADGTLVAKGGIFNGFLQMPFKSLSDSDVIRGNGTFRINRDMNIIVRISVENQGTVLLPNSIAYNGCMVNIFNPDYVWSYSLLPASIAIEGGGAFRENMGDNSLNNANYQPVRSINSAGKLCQFLCVAEGGDVFWVWVNST